MLSAFVQTRLLSCNLLPDEQLRLRDHALVGAATAVGPNFLNAGTSKRCTSTLRTPALTDAELPQRSVLCSASADFSAVPSQGVTTAEYRPLEDDVLDEDVEETWEERGERYVKVTTGAFSLLCLNEAIRSVFAFRGISFSPPLAGMLLTIAGLCVAKSCGQRASEAVDHLMEFYEPLRNWVARWMPIFFVPSLIALPRAAADIATESMVKMVGVTVVGWLASILLAIGVLKTIRNTFHSEITPDEVRRRSAVHACACSEPRIRSTFASHMLMNQPVKLESLADQSMRTMRALVGSSCCLC